jgi:hypothetical protein
MAAGMTAAEWKQIFPAWPPSKSGATAIDDIIRELEDRHMVQVLSVAVLPIAWPGLIEPEEDVQAKLISRVGRWCLTDMALLCLGENYWITLDRLDEEDWFAHLLEKDWLYDPSDMLLAFEKARAQFFPHEEPAQHAAAIDQQLQYASTYGTLLFHPAVLRHDHVYLVNRMTSDDERMAFCQFLADQGFAANDWTV